MRGGYSDTDESDPDRYGKLDTSRFTDIELRLYALIKSGKATMWELKNCYTLDEALKLYALLRMDSDIEAARSKEMADKNKRR